MITTTHILDDKLQFLNAAELIGAIKGEPVDASDILFFDIETTGLSPAGSFLYLIGCLYLENGRVLHRQFFSEGIDEEALLILAYDELLVSHKLLVHFNGQTFDIPYVEKKRAQLNITNPNPDIESFDIFRELKPLKKAFNLSSMSQKSLEVFAGLNRRDMYDGGQLIEVYNRYIAFKRLENLRSGSRQNSYDFSAFPSLGTPCGTSGELLEVLLLHNYEDVLGMLKVAELLGVVALFKGCYSVQSVSSGGDEAVITLAPKYCGACEAFTIEKRYELPGGVTVSVRTDQCGHIKISVPLFFGELKLFYPDYKNYVYLPGEDTAVHNSIGMFLDKSVKTKCTRANCYTRHCGTYLPWPLKVSAQDCSFCILKTAATDRFGYVEVSEALHDSHINEYLNCLFSALF